MNLNRTYITDAIDAPCLLSEMPNWLDYFCLKNNTSIEPQQISVSIKDGDMSESESGVADSDLTICFFGKLLYSNLATGVRDQNYHNGWRIYSMPLAEVGTAIFQKLDESTQKVSGHVIITISQNVKSKAIHLDCLETGKTVSHIFGAVNPYLLDIFALANLLLPESPKENLNALHAFCLKYVLTHCEVKSKQTINVDCLGVNYTIALHCPKSETLIMRSKFGQIGDLAMLKRNDVLGIVRQLKN